MSSLEQRLALSIRAAKLDVKIETHYDRKPIPSRECDWSATTDNYDVDWDGECWVANEPVGYGATELAKEMEEIGRSRERE